MHVVNLTWTEYVDHLCWSWDLDRRDNKALIGQELTAKCHIIHNINPNEEWLDSTIQYSVIIIGTKNKLIHATTLKIKQE